MRHSMTLMSGLLAAAMSATAVAGEHGSGKEAEAWSAASLRQALDNMPAGDVSRGEKLHGDLFCASCHGEKGEAFTMNWPSLTDQRAKYTYKMLLDYKNNLRNEDARGNLMVEMAQFLSEQDMADLSAFYAAQPLAEPPAEKVEVGEDIEKLVRQGDPKRLVTPCAACHGVNGEGGLNETPALAGQTPEYFIRTMKAYRDGDRTNDLYSGMSIFTKNLTDEEIESLANYYAALGLK